MSYAIPNAHGGLKALLAPVTRAYRIQLGMLAATSLLQGLVEATVLVFIARVAVALTAQDSTIALHAGPLDVSDVPVAALIVLAAVMAIVRFALQAAAAWQTAALTSRALAESRRVTVRLFLEASWGLQSKEREGELQELVTRYAMAEADTVLRLVATVTSFFNLVALLAVALALNVAASLLAGIAVVGLAVVTRPLRNAVRRRSRDTVEANLDVATAIAEIASTAQEIRIFAVQEQARRRIQSRIDEHRRSFFRVQLLSDMLPGLYQSVALLLIVGALGVVYAAGLGGLSTLGAAVLIMLRCLSYGQALQTSYQALHADAPYLESLQSHQRRYEQNAMPSGHGAVGPVGDMVFEDVWFEYEPGRPVLSSLSFRVKSGEIIGLVGPSGAGKSTLVQLLLRLREPTSGRILADARDIRGLSLDGWYERVTFVPQEGRLFSGTIAENIRFFRDVNAAAIERAAKLVYLHDEIASLPLSYDTPVGERGGSLSVGQRQRLCIARCLVIDPDVIVLDEPTSALDPKSESVIREALAALAPRATVFIIAHRLSTLNACDRIMVLQTGQLQGFDEPERLARSNRFYAEALRLSGLK